MPLCSHLNGSGVLQKKKILYYLTNMLQLKVNFSIGAEQIVFIYSLLSKHSNQAFAMQKFSQWLRPGYSGKRPLAFIFATRSIKRIIISIIENHE